MVDRSKEWLELATCNVAVWAGGCEMAKYSRTANIFVSSGRLVVNKCVNRDGHLI